MAFFSLDEMRELGSETFEACLRSHSNLTGGSRPQPYNLALGLSSLETPRN